MQYQMQYLVGSHCNKIEKDQATDVSLVLPASYILQ